MYKFSRLLPIGKRLQELLHAKSVISDEDEPLRADS
jgi:hypothetical protein